MYLYFHGLYNIYARDYQSRRREAPFKAEAIRNYLKDEPGFITVSQSHRLSNDGTCKCVVFTESAAPDFIRDLVSGFVPRPAGTKAQEGTVAGTP